MKYVNIMVNFMCAFWCVHTSVANTSVFTI